MVVAGVVMGVVMSEGMLLLLLGEGVGEAGVLNVDLGERREREEGCQNDF